MSPRAPALILSTLLLATPLVAASWGQNGSSEPNTPNDIKDGWMFQQPDTSPSQSVNKVYFDGFVSANQGGFAIGLAGGYSGNPNLATARSSVPLAEYDEYAILGVWKDCNKDGFIGLGDQGLWEYRAELLIDTSVCPRQSVPSPIPMNWMPVHNDGAWVHELIPIAWTAPSQGSDVNAFNINDNGARVWYDSGLPTPGPGGKNCWLNPPTGAMHSTGGTLWWADCIDGYVITDTIDKVAALNPALAPLSFADQPRNQYDSHSVLNQKNPWGDDSDASDAQVWDCSKTQVTHQSVDDPTASDGSKLLYVNASAPKVPPGVSTSGSAAGTANATVSGLDRCDRRTDTERTGTTAPDVETGSKGGAAANAPYALEAPVSQGDNKITSSGVLTGVATYHRPSSCAGDLDDYPLTENRLHYDHQCNAHVSTPLGDQPINTNVGSPTGAGTPPGFGQHFTSMDGVWFDYSTWTSPGVVGTTAHTYYAFVSPTAVSTYGLSLPKGASATGSYGVEFCGAATTGAHNGWDCDPTHWWLDTNGKDASFRSPYLGKDPTSTGPCTPQDAIDWGEDSGAGSRGCVEISPVPGSPYNLRDVDCYDYSTDAARHALGPQTVGVPGIAQVTENGCAPST